MAKLTILQKEVRKPGCSLQLTTGTVLAIDPSISSQSSQAGFAWYEAGQLKDAGILDIPSSKPTWWKLQELRRTLQLDFDSPDVLVIENIAPMRGGKNGIDFSATKGWKTLHQACGAVIASIDSDHVVQVAPQTWRKHMRNAGDTYIKSDAADATLIGYSAIYEAAIHLGTDEPKLYFIK